MTATESVTSCRSARDVLAWSRTMVDPSLRAAVDTLPASVRRIAGYHFGWVDENGQPDGADGGKAIRPALALLSTEAVGGVPATAVPAAVAVELVHIEDAADIRPDWLTGTRVVGLTAGASAPPGLQR